MKRMIINLLLFALIGFPLSINAQSLSGTTWSYTTRVYGSSKINSATTYFHFDSPTKVLWLLGTPDGKVFPVAIGNYNPNLGRIVFRATNSVNQYSELFMYSTKDIVFEFQPQVGTMRVASGESSSHGLISILYNDFQKFTVVKEAIPFSPSSKLIGQTWGGYLYNGDEDASYITLSFRTKFEVDVIVEDDEGLLSFCCPYILLGNILALHIGDHFTNLVKIGYYNYGSETIYLCWEGIEGREDELFAEPCSYITLIK